MASRYTPPAGADTQRNIIKARRSPPGDKLKGLVVGASLAGTLLGWAVFAQQEAPDVTVPAVDATQAVAPAQTTGDSGGFVLPDLGSLWAALTGGQTGQDTSTDPATTVTTTSAAQGSGSTTVRTAFTTTQSSR